MVVARDGPPLWGHWGRQENRRRNVLSHVRQRAIVGYHIQRREERIHAHFNPLSHNIQYVSCKECVNVLVLNDL